jgi:hypothetical protein
VKGTEPKAAAAAAEKLWNYLVERYEAERFSTPKEPRKRLAKKKK